MPKMNATTGLELATATTHEFLTADEAATLLRVHRSTIHEMCREGVLPAIKAGRDWRISRQGLLEKREFGDVHLHLINAIADRAADVVIERMAMLFADAFTSVAAQQQIRKYERKG